MSVDSDIYHVNYDTDVTPNTAAFCTQYDAILQRPLAIQDHVGPIEFGSSESLVQARLVALTDYLRLPCKLDWGRTIFSEYCSAVLIHEALGYVLDYYGLSVHLVPTDLDSTKNCPYELAKGMDIAIVNNMQELVLGIDVTLATTTRFLNRKYKFPPVNLVTASPVVVLPLAPIKIGGLVYSKHLDNLARIAVRSGQQYDPFANMSIDEKTTDTGNFLITFEDAVRTATSNLFNTSNTNITNYPFYGELFDKLNFATGVVRDAFQLC